MNVLDEMPDFSYLQMVSKGNKDFELVLIQSTLKSIEENLLKMQDGISILDPNAVKRAAHAMKPLFAIAGTKKLQHQCNELDQMHTNQQEKSMFISMAQEIVDYWKTYQKKLQDYFPGINNS